MESKWSDNERREDVQGWLAAAHRLPRVRTEKVERVRLALANRTYENDFVLEQTVERLSLDMAWLD